MSVIVFGMNLILTITALIMLYTIMHETGYTGEIPYQSFIQLSHDNIPAIHLCT